MEERKKWIILLGMFTFFVYIGSVQGQVKVYAGEANAAYDGTYGYSTLSARLKQVYQSIDALMQEFDESSEDAKRLGKENKYYIVQKVDFLKQELTVEELSKVMFAINADHPSYFWYEGVQYTYADKEKGHIVTTVSVQVSSEYAKGTQRRKACEQLERGLSSYKSLIMELKRQSAPQIEIELAIHDKLIQEIVYKEESGPQKNTVIGAFVNKVAVCEGYAKAFQMLATYAGIECIYAVGYGNDMGHAWNLVKLDGKWFYVDVTWDDVPEGVSYQYFNCTEDVFQNGHYYSSDFIGMYKLPKISTSKSYGYFEYYNLRVYRKDLESNEMFVEKISQAVGNMVHNNEATIQVKVHGNNKAKWKKMWNANEIQIMDQIKKEGRVYAFGALNLKEEIVTIHDVVYAVYELTVEKVEVKIDQKKRYIGEAQYKVMLKKGENVQWITEQTSSKYKDGKLKVYYKGVRIGTYQVTVSKLKAGSINTYVYNGKEKCPNPVIWYGNNRLKENQDYTIRYKNNISAGKAVIIVTGKGSYAGKQQITFTIKKKSIEECKVTFQKKYAYTGKKIKPQIVVKQNGKVVKKKNYTLTYVNNRYRGMGRIIIKAKGNNYKGTKSVSFKIV